MSFCITIRPKNGLHSEYDTAIMKYIEKQPYGAYSHEMEDEARHLHAQIWVCPQRSTDINNIRKALFRIGQKCDPDWSPASKKVLSQGVKHAYNDEFYKTYMIKDNALEYSVIPENTEPYYPSEEEQAAAMASKTCVADAYFDHLKREWDELHPDYDFQYQTVVFDVARFYYDMMFKYKKISVIRDDRSRKQNAKCLVHYLFPHQISILDSIMTKEDSELYLEFKSQD